MRRIRSTLAVASFIVLAASVVAAAEREAVVFPLAEVEPGLRGYGLSVFSGTETERFEVEALGVWRNVRPGMSFVLARLTGMDLEKSGVIAGMSGSPVYFDDRVVGAVAFAWPFSHEAIAGITPIETMRGLLTAGRQGASPLAKSATVGLEDIARGEFPPDLLATALRRLGPDRVGQARAGVGYVAAGFGGAARRLMEEPLGGVAAAGAAGGSSGDLEPGSAVAVVLVDGDLRLAATGTVTDRIGDAILAFGHAFLGGGDLSVPMAGAEVVTVLSSRYQSFKVTNLGEVEGAFSLDHQAGILGEVGAEAAMIPLKVSIDGSGDELAELRVADIPAITPILVAISVLGVLDSATEVVGKEGIDLIAKYDLGIDGQLVLEQSFDGPAAQQETAIHLLAVTAYLLQNNLEDVSLEGLEVELTRHKEPRTMRLVSAHAARAEVEPGESVVLNLELMEYRGGSQRRAITVKVPAGLEQGRYSLLVGDGVSIDAARLAVERTAPINFPQALEFLNSLHSSRDLVVVGVVPGKGLSVAGEVMPQLPASVRSLWSAAGQSGAAPLELALVDQKTERLTTPVEGVLRVDLDVKPTNRLVAAEKKAGEGRQR